MSHVIEVIRQRRSIRKYLQQPIPHEVLREIIEAARWAPSAHNAQPSRFIVLTDPSAKRSLAGAMAQAWMVDLQKDGKSQTARAACADASVERFVNAPVLVVACLTMKDMVQFPDEERQLCEHDLAVQSLSAAIQNLLLTAHAKQLGSCWYCAPIFCKSTIRQALRLPEDVEPQALITIGYPNDAPKAPPRRSLRSIAYLNVWGGEL